MRSPTLSELPAPPQGRVGWPWTEETPPLPATMADGRPWPRIGIVTPSYNQAAFLEETIRSVLLQGYPNLAYVVVDDGSTDDSLEVVRRYERWLTHWETGPNRGQASAINRGWARLDGELLAFLNSDDTYLPGALARAAEAWAGTADVAMVTGGIESIDAASRVIARASPRLEALSPLDISVIDHETYLLPQPSSFFSRAHLDRVGRWLRTDLRYTLDRELMYRLCRTGRVVLLPEALATYRLHAGGNTTAAVLRMHAEAPRALAYCTWGGPEAAARRALVGRWRVAKGHYLYAQTCPSRAEALRHLARACLLRPSYMDPRRRGFVRVLLRAVRPSGAARGAVRRLSRVAAGLVPSLPCILL